MNTPRSHARRLVSALGACALALALPVAAQGRADASDLHLVYLPSTSPAVDQSALINAFGDLGFTVHTVASAGDDQLAYARRAAARVRALIDAGVDPDAITVVGAGSGSPVATLTSAVVGNRRVNYALLGQCDARTLTEAYRFRMSGRVLGVRADSDTSSHSCRPLWQDSPRVSERRDLVLHSEHGSALFDRPREEWLQPLSVWSQGGHVRLGEMRVGYIEPRTQATGADR